MWDRLRYPPNWEEIALAIKERAGWCCEWCSVAHRAERSGRKGKLYKVVMTVAHLGIPYPDGRPGDKHDKWDVRPENLACLCQACHLRFDHDDHVQHAKATRQRKKREAALAAGQLPLAFEDEAPVKHQEEVMLVPA